jgi:hypothetical protein
VSIGTRPHHSRQTAVPRAGRRSNRTQEGRTVGSAPPYTPKLVTFAGIGLALGNGLSLTCAVLIPFHGLV